MKFVVKNSTGKLEKYFIDAESGTAHKVDIIMGNNNKRNNLSPGQICGNIMFPINVSLFANLGKHLLPKKICFKICFLRKNVSQQIPKHFVAETIFLVCPDIFKCFQHEKTSFSQLGMLKQCLKTIVQT